jgi:LPXTG-motif cell wall-anchored protein
MMIPIPAPTSSQPAADPVRDFRVALRLLSGKDCERDAPSAQVMLLTLAEGQNKLISRDATRVLKTGAERGWFRDVAPPYYELERIAEESLARGNDMARKKLVALLAAGILALVVGVFVFMAQQTGEQESYPVLMLMIIIALAGGLIAFKSRQ